MKILRLLGLLLLIGVGLLAWPSLRDWRHDFVAPTPLLADETPMAAICRIRTEFLALPNPVYEGFTRHDRWERQRLGAPTQRFGPFWEIDLDWTAWRFARRHSRLEIVAAIGPYLSDPQLAPKAVAVLAGLPVGSRERLDQVQTLSILLAEPEKFVPDSVAASPWTDPQLSFAQGALRALYGVENSADRLQGVESRPHPNTLEGSLLDILQANDGLKGAQFEAVDVSDTPTYPDYDALLQKLAPPAPLPSFQAFLKRWPRELMASALFPLALDATSGDNGSSNRERYMRIMGREAAYWPLHAQRLFNSEAQAAAYRRETGEFARSLCRGDQPRKL
ncbi:MAG: hypothetical protein AB7P11_13505 [Hydrogenophaga sp.]|uniref:hypothetical protein n=1 Tax=Hydrogenophaga sp. TaxID=1904254 RepID=UPI003D14D00A